MQPTKYWDHKYFCIYSNWLQTCGNFLLHDYCLCNRVLKDLQKWKEAPLDCVLLLLYQLQAFYLNETKWGLVGLGEYSIAPEYHFITFDHLDVQYLPTSSPDEIVQRIKEGASMIGNVPAPQLTPIARDQEHFPADTFTRTLSAQARSQSVISAGNMTFDPKLHCFNVKGLSGVTRVVTLFPKPSCSCPSTGDCYHILAVKLSVGMSTASEPAKRNLTRLRKKHTKQEGEKMWQKETSPKWHRGSRPWWDSSQYFIVRVVLMKTNCNISS